jgi:2-dehydropantoate 2-reductase
MRTVILGGGALGSILAAHLHRAGHEVALVAREPRASLLAREGIRITGLLELTAKVPVHNNPAIANDADLVINALKTYQSSAVVRALRPKRGAVAFSVQNGVFKNEELAAVFGVEQVLGAIALVSGEVMADGSTRFTNNDPLYVGSLGQSSSQRCEEISAMFREAGIASEVSADIREMEWSKYTMFVPLFCCSLLTRQETHRFLSHPKSARVVASLCREMAQLAKAEGVMLRSGPGLSAAAMAEVDVETAVGIVREAGAQFARKARDHKVSGLQDLERGRPTELEEIAGYAHRRSEQLGLALDTLRTCYHLCSAISPPVPIGS